MINESASASVDQHSLSVSKDGDGVTLLSTRISISEPHIGDFHVSEIRLYPGTCVRDAAKASNTLPSDSLRHPNTKSRPGRCTTPVRPSGSGPQKIQKESSGGPDCNIKSIYFHVVAIYAASKLIPNTCNNHGPFALRLARKCPAWNGLDTHASTQELHRFAAGVNTSEKAISSGDRS